MARYRDAYIEKEKTLADSGTLVTELAVVDPISEIHIRFEAKNGGTSNKNNPISRNISKIELVDGSNVVYSLDGMLSQSMSYYQRRKMPSMQRQGGPSENQEDHFILRFGRWLWDQDFALVPAKFRNLQLKITWDLATYATVGATGFLADSAVITIIAKVMEDMGGEPGAYMMAKSHYSWTTAGSGDERIALPSDHPYLLMLLRTWETETKLFSTIKNLKLSIDQDKIIPFDLDSWDLLKAMENEYGLFTLEQHAFAGTEQNVQTWMGNGETVVATTESPVDGAGVTNTYPALYGVDSGHINIALTDSAGTDDVDSIIHVIARGQALNHTFAYPFGLPDNPESWLPAPDYGDIKAVITQGNAGAAGNLALLQVKSY